MAEFRKKKQYGQNFLTNVAIPKRIVAESGITDADGVIEIGPGLGILTRELCAAAKRVVSVEIDNELAEILPEKLSDCKNFSLINADILQTDINALIHDEFPGMRVCVCANLPYYITSDIIMKLLEGEYGFGTITVMVQKEVAERFCSLPGTEGYGAITASINYYAKVKRLFTVKAGSFDPRPKVDSAVIRFDPYTTPPVSFRDKKTFFAVIRAAFIQRRKTLANSLCACFPQLEKESACAVLQSCGLSPAVRGEQLGIADYARIADHIFDIK